MSNVIDVILRVQRVGEQEIKKTLEELKKIAPEIKKSFGLQVFQPISDNIEGINKQITGISAVVKKASGVVQSVSAQTSLSVQQDVSQINRSLTTLLKGTVIATGAIWAAQIQSVLPALARGAEILKNDYLGNTSRLVELVRGFRFSMDSILGVLAESSWHIIAIATRSMFISATVVGVFGLLRKSFTAVNNNMSTLERITAIVYTVERSMHVTNQIFQHLAHTAGWLLAGAAASMTGIINPLFMIVPALNSLFSVFQNLMLERRLSFMGKWFANGSAQIQLIILIVRRALFRLLPLISKALPKIEAALKKYLQSLPKVEGTVSKIAKGVGGAANSLARGAFSVLTLGIPKGLREANLLLDEQRKKQKQLSMGKQGALGMLPGQTLLPAPGQQKALPAPSTGLYSTIRKLFTGEFPKAEKEVAQVIQRIVALAVKLYGIETKKANALIRKASEQRIKELFYSISVLLEKEGMGQMTKVANNIGQKFPNVFAKKVQSGMAKIFKMRIPRKTDGQAWYARLFAGMNAVDSDQQKMLYSGLPLDQLKTILPKLVAAGKKIPQFLAQGMRGGIGVVKNATHGVAEMIAKFFPRSPALLGPLVYLTAMGMKIPYYIGAGITKGAFSAVRAVVSLAKAIAGKIKGILGSFKTLADEIANLSRMAARTGIALPQLSGMDFALKQIGENASSLEPIFTRLNKSISEGFSEDDIKRLFSVGVNLKAVERSATPAMELLYQLSDVLKENAVNSKAYQTALELLQQTYGSKVVTVLAQGRVELQRSTAEGFKAGAVYDEALGKISERFSVIMSKFSILRNRYLSWAVETILPTLTDLLEKIYKSSIDNAGKIRVYFMAIYNIIVAIIKISSVLIMDIIKDPGTALSKFKDTLIAILDAAAGFISDNADAIYIKIQIMLAMFLRFVMEASLKIIQVIMPALMEGILPVMGRIFQYAMMIATSVGRVIGAAIFGDSQAAIRNLIDEARITEQVYAREEKRLRNPEMAAAMAEAQSQKEIELGRKLTGREMHDFRFKFEDEFTDGGKGFFENIFSNFQKMHAEIAASFGDSEIPDAIGNLSKRISSGLSNIISPESRDEFNKALSELGNAIKGLSPEEIEAELKKFDETVAAFVEDQTATLDTLPPAAESAAVGIAENLRQVPIIIGKISADINLQLAQMAKKLAEGGNFQFKGMFGDADLLELDARQAEELQKFKDLQERRLAFVQHYEELITLEKAQQEELRAFQGMQALERTQQLEKARQEAIQKTLGVVSETINNWASAFNDLYEMSGEKIKEFFYLSKAAAIADAVIKTAQAVMNALWTGGPYLGPVLAASAAAAGTVQVAKITSQTLGFEQGGLVTQGSGRGDDVPAMLGRGEFVLRASAVKNLGSEYLQRLNKGVRVPRFNTGGMVGSLSVPKGQQNGEGSAPIINIANLVDPSQTAQYFATSAGKNAFINIVSDNAPAIRGALGSR